MKGQHTFLIYLEVLVRLTKSSLTCTVLYMVHESLQATPAFVWDLSWRATPPPDCLLQTPLTEYSVSVQYCRVQVFTLQFYSLVLMLPPTCSVTSDLFFFALSVPHCGRKTVPTVWSYWALNEWHGQRHMAHSRCLQASWIFIVMVCTPSLPPPWPWTEPLSSDSRACVGPIGAHPASKLTWQAETHCVVELFKKNQRAKK